MNKVAVLTLEQGAARNEPGVAVVDDQRLVHVVAHLLLHLQRKTSLTPTKKYSSLKTKQKQAMCKNIVHMFFSSWETSLPPPFYERVLPFVNLMSLSALSTAHHKSVLSCLSSSSAPTFWSTSHFPRRYDCYFQVLVSHQFPPIFHSSKHYTVTSQSWVSLNKSSRCSRFVKCTFNIQKSNPNDCTAKYSNGIQFHLLFCNEML